MPLVRPLAAVMRLVRTAYGLSQEQLSGANEARHTHNLENAKASATIDTLEVVGKRLGHDPVALLAYASRVERGMTLDQYMAYLSEELRRIADLGIDAEIDQHYKDGEVITHKPGRRTDPVKVEAVLRAKAAGKTKRETSDALGMAWSTVNDIWKKGI
ncbi:hypothetical protein PPUJ20066_10720 [Pseudomonas putida]|nr:hypothetical protein PPUJ20066_10720 [Pseudomonas putida]